VRPARVGLSSACRATPQPGLLCAISWGSWQSHGGISLTGRSPWIICAAPNGPASFDTIFRYRSLTPCSQ
jgi:hypothetical protein